MLDKKQKQNLQVAVLPVGSLIASAIARVAAYGDFFKEGNPSARSQQQQFIQWLAMAALIFIKFDSHPKIGGFWCSPSTSDAEYTKNAKPSTGVGHELCHDLYHLLGFHEWRRKRDNLAAVVGTPKT